MDNLSNGNNQNQAPQMLPENIEPQLTDGLTDQLTEFQQRIREQEDFGADCSLTMTNSGIYTQEEFNKCFNDFLTFLKSPEVAADTFGNIHERGQQIASTRIYELAQKYRFLRFLIDKNAHLFGDIAIVSLWGAIEANAIILNWTGINYLTKAKLWLNEKIKQKAQKSAESKRKGWGFLGRPVAEKQPKPEV